MRKQTIVLIAFFAIMPAWSQVQPAATGDVAPIEDENVMVAPPIASGLVLPNSASSDQRSNFITASVNAQGSYIDNVLPDATATPVADYVTSIAPSVSLDRTTPRQEEKVSYNPSFTFYKQTTELNALNEDVAGMFERRLSPHLALGLNEDFVRTSNVFDTQYPFTPGGITGSTQPPVAAVIVPFAEQMSNNSNVNLTYQFSPKAMVGGGGMFTNFRYPNQAQSPGLFNSDSSGGSAFYNRRLTHSQYFGAMYQYNDIMSYQPVTNVKVESQIHSALPFYMLSFAQRFSLSASGGVQRLRIMAHPDTVTTSWSPTGILSFGWQGDRGGISASFLYTTVAGQGLVGAFTSEGENVSAGLKIARTWTGSASFSYQSTNAVTSLTELSYSGGTGITGMASLEHSIGDRMSITAGYDRLQENYHVAAVSANPDSDRAFVSVSYKLTKSLGR